MVALVNWPKVQGLNREKQIRQSTVSIKLGEDGELEIERNLSPQFHDVMRPSQNRWHPPSSDCFDTVLLPIHRPHIMMRKPTGK